MVNQKKEILCAAVIFLVHCTKVSLNTSSLFAQVAPWYADAATGISPPVSQPKALPKTLHPLEWPIVFFQKVLSPQDGEVCRFRPTCSAYGRQAIARFGAFKGILLTADRLIRDNPYNPMSYDPVESVEEP